MATGLAEAGADIIGVSASLEDTGSEIELAVRNAGRSFAAYRCDFADRRQLYELIAKIRDNHSVV